MNAPTLNALLNAVCLLFLLAGFYFIKHKHLTHHKLCMLSAAMVSALFLVSYLIYHRRVGSVPYPYHDWTRLVYFSILIPHSIFAALITPAIFAVLSFALRQKYELHRKWVQWVWPIWVFVSISGIIVYLLLYHR